jgi:uncharacterized protein (DUF433 family)
MQSAAEQVDLSKYIEIQLMGQRPHIRGRRLPVAFVASAQRENDLSIAEIAEAFTLSEEEVLAALLYYREHRALIDAQDADEIRLWQKEREAQPNRFRNES